jgi:raffinose/stachyose/melibiose transport system substrate-binding protein
MTMIERSRRDFLKLGAGALGAGMALPALADQAVTHAAPRSRAASYSYNLWTYVGPAGGTNVFKKMVSDYNSTKGQNLSFNISAISGSGFPLYEAKIQSLISSGQSPDLWQNWIGSLSRPYIKAGAVQPLDAWFAKYGWDTILLPNAIDYVSYKGHRYGVPISLRLMPLWYNKKLFAKAGITAFPKTYAGVEAMNAQLVKAGITPLASGAIFGWDLMRLFQYLLEVAVGPAYHDKLLTLQASWDTPQVAEAFALLKKWGDNGWIEKGFLGTNPNDADNLFQAGKIAMDLTGGWEENQLKQAGVNEADFDVFVPPTGHTPTRFSGFAEQWQISTKVTGPRLDALGDFMNWIVQPAQVQKYFYNTGTATKNGIPAGNPGNTKILALSETYKSYTVMDEMLSPQLINVYFSLQDQVCKGSVTPKSAAQQMQKAAVKIGA